MVVGAEQEWAPGGARMKRLLPEDYSKVPAALYPETIDAVRLLGGVPRMIEHILLHTSFAHLVYTNRVSLQKRNSAVSSGTGMDVARLLNRWLQRTYGNTGVEVKAEFLRVFDKSTDPETSKTMLNIYITPEPLNTITKHSMWEVREDAIRAAEEASRRR